MRLVLHDYWRSSAGYRVRVALHLKGVAYERVAVDLLTGEQRGEPHRGRQPQGLVPTLTVDGVVLTQSVAIVEWLDEAFPAPRLLPADPLARARARARALLIAADLHPLDNLRVLKRLEQQFGADQAARDDWYRHWLVVGLDALEAMAGDGGGPFLGGDAPDLSDLCLVPQLYNARRFAIATDRWPRLVAADAACAAMPAVAAAHPDRFKP